MGVEDSEYPVTKAHYFTLVKKSETSTKYGAIQNVLLEVDSNDFTPSMFKRGKFEVGIPIYRGEQPLNDFQIATLIEEDLGFCLSEIVYWVNSNDFNTTSRSRPIIGIKNPNGFYFDLDDVRHVKIKSVVHGLTNREAITVSGNIIITKGNVGIVYSFAFKTDSSGNHTGN
jgi:hypothetical protein